MRHGRKINHLGRTASHRKALMSNMASSLILHKRINTTVAKAKELRKFVEPLLTRAKQDSTHSRRMVFSYLNNKESVKVLFTEVADRIMDRPGGYTRIIKTGQRLGDNAEMCLMELVDFNDLYTKETGEKKTRTRRSRRGGSKSDKLDEVQEASASEATAEVAEDRSAENKDSKTEKSKAKPKTDKKEAKPAKSSSSDKAKAKSSDKKSSSKTDKKDKGGKKGKK